MVRTGGKLLGHLIGRDGSSPDPERSRAVQEFAPLREKLHVQQFLGCSNWLRTYLPAQFGCAAKVLTGYQKPGAVFPPEGLGYGQTAGCQAVRAIKKMLSEAIGIAVFDEAAAISGECPLEQVADASGYAVGGTVLQMTRDLQKMKVLLTHSKSLTAPQQSWPPLIQEAFAQLEVKRMTRKTLGSVKTLCWTDHANLTKAQHVEVGADVKLVRWIAEIISDGSEIRSLSGRSAKLGDGFSRNPKMRDQLLEDRTKDVQGLAGQLQGFDMAEYLGEGSEDSTVPVTWAVGDDAVPDSSGGVPGSGRHAGEASSSSGGDPGSGHRAESSVTYTADAKQKVRVLIVADYCSHRDTVTSVSKIHASISRGMPGWDVSIHTVYGAFEDDHGLCAHIDGATARLKGERQVKRLRVDLLTSCAKVLRGIGSFLPNFVAGVGQGGLIAAMVRLPLVVEITLQARNLQRSEIHKVVSGWSGVKAVWSFNPRLWKTQAGVDLLLAACPEIAKNFPIVPVKGYGIAGQGSKEHEVAVSLSLGILKDAADVPLVSLVNEPNREVWEHDGKCSCGKRAYVFGRCVTCIEKEAADDLQAGAAAREALEQPAGGEGELVAEDFLAVSSVPLGPEPRVCSVHWKLVVDWARSWIAECCPKGFHDLPNGLGAVALCTWWKNQGFEFPSGKASDQEPFGFTWVVYAAEDVSLNTVCVVHQCADFRCSTIEPVRELSEVNWYNHVKLVKGVCDVFYSQDVAFGLAPHEFKRLVALLGNATGVVRWDDGNGVQSIGLRRDLRHKQVLVSFQKNPASGYWFPFKVGKKIRVDESASRPTVAILGKSWSVGVVVHLRSRHWIIPQWVGAREMPSTDIKTGVIHDSEVPSGGVPDSGHHAGSEEEERVPNREEFAIEARLEAGLGEFTISGSLRSAWHDAQRKDESLVGHFRRTGDPFRIAADGLLERSVLLESGEKSWVAVIPGGFAAPNGLTWRRCCFDRAHHGALGGHRSSERTLSILSRSVWWPGMKDDVRRWTDKCIICLKARSKPKKVTAGASRCLADCCWQEVSVDCEGPSREDRWGFRYTLTYLDCLSHAVLIEPMRSITHAEVRRAFARCIFRSRTLPTLVRSDRGVEFRNAMMAEFCSLMNIKQKFSMAMRPCEMGSNERMHQEVQKILHVIIREVVHGDSDEWSELLPLVEFLLDNSPGPHGFTPRDLERSWSLGLDLEKDLIRESLQFEPVSEWGRKQFAQFASLSRKVAGHWEKASAARAKLANRYRRTLELKVGDRVVWQSPQARPEGAGRVPWKRGLSGPWEVTEVRGHKLTLKLVHDPTSRSVEAHAEDCVLIPEDLEDPAEGRDIVFDAGPPDEAPSIGQRILGEGEQREFVLQRRGRQFVLRIGDVVAYTKGRKICQFGKVTQVSVGDGTIGVQKFRAISGSQLRVKWVLSLLNEEGVPSPEGTRPDLDQVRLKEIITKADISRDGILAAATSRKLDKAGYRLHEEGGLGLLQVVGCESAVDLLVAAMESELPSKLPLGTSSEGAALWSWLKSKKAGKVAFLEIYAGGADLTAAARRHGFSAAPAIDKSYPSYGRSWDLRRKGDRDLVDLLVMWLEPEVVHFGFPDFKVHLDGINDMLEHAVSVMRRQVGLSRSATFESSFSSKVFQEGCLVAETGPLYNPSPPWAVVRTDSCQFGLSLAPDPAACATAEDRAQLWVSNEDLSHLSLRCKRPDALGAVLHQHTARISTGSRAGKKAPAFCQAFWDCMSRCLQCRESSRSHLCHQGRLAPCGLGLGIPDLAAVSVDTTKEQEVKVPPTDVDVSGELSPQEREALEKSLQEYSVKMAAYWDNCASEGKWDEVKADLSVYRLSGQEIKKDPRREKEYREQVLDGLGFGPGSENPRTDLGEDDLLACRDVLTRKAAAFWLEGTPRTTVRNVAHDCIPTGPPISLQPHSLKGESAAWVDERLEEEVQRGQLVRGHSAWGSPPFPTKEMPAHKRHRKRRLVVDYRRVNARVLRSTYYCRKATDVLAQCSGSVWYSFVDAVTGFNQIANTRRAMEILAIVARSGKFLPVCLTFGPVNGPDDFCFVVDRAFGPGRNRKGRYTKEWVAYVDDLTIRTGRSIDGKFLTDAEHDQEIKESMRNAPVEIPQSANDAIEALGIQPKGVGAEKVRKHDEKVSDHNHPTRPLNQRSWFTIRSRVREIPP